LRAEASIELQRGRGWLAGEQGLIPLDPGVLRRSSGSAHLELVSGARVAVHWLGRASLRARGPGSLEWHGEEAGPSRLIAYRCAELYLELRAGPLQVELPGQCTLVLFSGHFHLGSTPGGGWRIEHDAGASAELWRAGPYGLPLRADLHPGGTLILEPPRAPPRAIGASSALPWLARGTARGAGRFEKRTPQGSRELALLLCVRAAASAAALLNAFAPQQP
jgi:hypothetical protein